MQKTIRWLYLIFFAVLVFLLLYSRTVNLRWGLPYPFHPDERNIADALLRLNCDLSASKNFGQTISNCFNPKFFAYGQFPIYLAYILEKIRQLIFERRLSSINFTDGIMSLRFISASFSILSALLSLKIIAQFIKKNIYYPIWQIMSLLIIIFTPFYIQFAHFGTTESLLMFSLLSVFYISLRYLDGLMDRKRFFYLSSLVCGIAIAVKISAVELLFIPFMAVLFKRKSSKLETFFMLVRIVILSILVSIIFSPQNFISFNDFLGAMKYESGVATGLSVFYTRQFQYGLPIFFQFIKIFPYSLGQVTFILFLFGFFLLPFQKKYNFLRVSFLILFLSNAFMFAKWTRFVSIAMPLMVIVAILFFYELLSVILKRISNNYLSKVIAIGALSLLTFFIIAPGVAYLNVYTSEDVRFRASDWISKNINPNKTILSETANVIDIPVINPQEKHFKKVPSLDNISFNFYDLENDVKLQKELEENISKADYIFIPSRRIFKNFICATPENSLDPRGLISLEKLNSLAFLPQRCEQLYKQYPLLNDYYHKLFSGELGFTKVAEFESFPKISIFGKTVVFPDENAEETWSVFDHPVIRIFKKN